MSTWTPILIQTQSIMPSNPGKWWWLWKIIISKLPKEVGRRGYRFSGARDFNMRGYK